MTSFWAYLHVFKIAAKIIQNLTESYIVVDSLFNVPRNICGGSVLVFVLLCISLCSFYFCQHLDKEENDSCFALIAFLMPCDCKCSVALHHDAVGLSAVVSVFFSCLYSLTFCLSSVQLL